MIHFRNTIEDVKAVTAFKVYWNSPTFQCASHKIYFTEVAQQFGIIQNTNDTFRGNEIVIMYDPGYFPALLEQKGTKQLFYRNGGVPQQGNLTVHLEYFRKHVEEQIPDINFDGKIFLCIDYDYLILFCRNRNNRFRKLAPYFQAKFRNPCSI